MVAVRLPENMERKLETYAKTLHKTKTEIVKEALAKYFKSYEQKRSAYELGENLFGKYKSGKDNLSTTYKQQLKDKIRAK
jgi:predicted DNA-binding protein